MRRTLPRRTLLPPSLDLHVPEHLVRLRVLRIDRERALRVLLREIVEPVRAAPRGDVDLAVGARGVELLQLAEVEDLRVGDASRAQRVAAAEVLGRERAAAADADLLVAAEHVAVV